MAGHFVSRLYRKTRKNAEEKNAEEKTTDRVEQNDHRRHTGRQCLPLLCADLFTSQYWLLHAPPFINVKNITLNARLRADDNDDDASPQTYNNPHASSNYPA
jgi:hypothetical protein